MKAKAERRMCGKTVHTIGAPVGRHAARLRRQFGDGAHPCYLNAGHDGDCRC